MEFNFNHKLHINTEYNLQSSVLLFHTNKCTQTTDIIRLNSMFTLGLIFIDPCLDTLNRCFKTLIKL